MINEARYARLRSLLRQFNRQRRRQARQIDILCRDLIAAQRRFIKDLETISMAADFYRSILGLTDQARLMDIAAKTLTEHLISSSLLFYIRNHGVFRQYPAQPGITDDHSYILQAITTDLAEAICRSGKVCQIDDLLMLGLQVNPSVVGRLAVVAVPMEAGGKVNGLILVCRDSNRPISQLDIQRLSAVGSGLGVALEAIQKVPTN